MDQNQQQQTPLDKHPNDSELTYQKQPPSEPMPQENRPLTGRMVFKFFHKEVEKLKSMLPKHYSFMKLDLLLKLEQKIVHKGKGSKQLNRMKFVEKKISSIEEIEARYSSDQPVVYPVFDKPIICSDAPQIFIQVCSVPDPRKSPYKEAEVIKKVKRAKPKKEVPQFIITKVYEAGMPLPKPSCFMTGKKAIKERERQRSERREQKRKFKQEMLRREMEQEQEREKERAKRRAQKKSLNNKAAQQEVIPPLAQNLAVDEVIKQITSNSKFKMLSEAQTRPSMKFLWKMALAKRKKQYGLSALEEDIKKLFKVFYSTSNEKKTNIKEAQLYQTSILNFIQSMKLKVNPKLKDVECSMQSSWGGAAQPLPIGESNSLRLRRRQISRDNSMERRKTRAKSWRKRDIERLGKNICNMPKGYLQDFCLQFCSESIEKNRGMTAQFEFDLLKILPSRLNEMQRFVRRALLDHDRYYLQLSSDDSTSDFVIECD